MTWGEFRTAPAYSQCAILSIAEDAPVEGEVFVGHALDGEALLHRAAAGVAVDCVEAADDTLPAGDTLPRGALVLPRGPGGPGMHIHLPKPPHGWREFL